MAGFLPFFPFLFFFERDRRAQKSPIWIGFIRARRKLCPLKSLRLKFLLELAGWICFGRASAAVYQHVDNMFDVTAQPESSSLNSLVSLCLLFGQKLFSEMSALDGFDHVTFNEKQKQQCATGLWAVSLKALFAQTCTLQVRRPPRPVCFHSQQKIRACFPDLVIKRHR